jgi:hypothetical protein
VATRKDLFGCPGESRWLARGIKLRTYTSSFPLFYLRLHCGRQNVNTTLSLQLKFGNIVRVETSRRFLQPSIQLRYNYYVQLVATKRDWMRVPNLKSRSARQRGGEAGRAHHCSCTRGYSSAWSEKNSAWSKSSTWSELGVAAERGPEKVDRGRRWGSAKAKRGPQWNARKRSAVLNFHLYRTRISSYNLPLVTIYITIRYLY